MYGQGAVISADRRNQLIAVAGHIKQAAGHRERCVFGLKAAHVGHKVHRYEFGAKVRSGVITSTLAPASAAIPAACRAGWSPALARSA
mgnify:CR=1 FL=1